MLSDEAEQELQRSLQDRSGDRFELAAARAGRLGADGDRLLSAAWPTARGWRKVLLTSELGNVRGTAGGAVLREALRATGAGSHDVRFAAVVALARREGAAAAPELRRVLEQDRAGVVKDVAIGALTWCGDTGAVPAVLHRLTSLLHRPGRRTNVPSPVVMAVCYLARAMDTDRSVVERTASAVRTGWAGLLAGHPTNEAMTDAGESDWFVRAWPEVAPEGPPLRDVPPPHAAAVRTWLRATRIVES